MLQPILNFRTPVLFEEAAVRELCCLARRGYRTRFKRETFGFLFGHLTQDRRLIIGRACYYRGGKKTRTGVVFKDWPTIMRVARRRRELARHFRLRFLGNFHSHVEIAGWVFKGLSPEDRASFREDTMAALEVIVFVWPGRSRTVRSSTGTIVGHEPRTGLNYRIRVYAKRRNGIRQVRARVIASEVVIVF